MNLVKFESQLLLILSFSEDDFVGAVAVFLGGKRLKEASSRTSSFRLVRQYVRSLPPHRLIHSRCIPGVSALTCHWPVALDESLSPIEAHPSQVCCSP